MSKDWYCEMCSEYMLPDHHCPPAWKCYDMDRADPVDAYIVYAIDAATAAEKYSKDRDDSDSDGRDDRTVAVHPFSDGGVWIRYDVTVECVPEYSAIERPWPKEGE